MLRLLSSSTGQVTVGRGVPACERKEVGGAESGEGGGLTDAGVVARVAGLPHQAVGRLQDQVTDEELPSFVKSPAAHVVIFSGSWSEVVVVSCTVVTAPSNERSPVTSRESDETVWVTRPRAFFKFVVRRDGQHTSGSARANKHNRRKYDDDDNLRRRWERPMVRRRCPVAPWRPKNECVVGHEFFSVRGLFRVDLGLGQRDGLLVIRHSDTTSTSKRF